MIAEPRQSDYLAFQRDAFDPERIPDMGRWDYFLSAYDESERVQTTHNLVNAEKKQWLVHGEYQFPESSVPEQSLFIPETTDGFQFIDRLSNELQQYQSGSICIDATGFIRPHLLMLLRILHELGINEYEVLYSDPVRYKEDERTAFTTGPVTRVVQIPGYEGVHPPPAADEDLLIIGAGYDHEQIARACDAKRHCKKFIFTAFPALQPHMFQESVIRIAQADEWIGPLTPEQRLYASANHPFVVAQIIRDVVARERQRMSANGFRAGNIYLCPLGPKPHVLGFGFVYLREFLGASTSIIYPFAKSYSRLTTEGLLRVWRYRFEY